MLLAPFDLQTARHPQEVPDAALPADTERREPSRVDRVKQALQAACYRQLRVIVVSVRGEAVLLRGQVCSFHMKQMAQVIALPITGLGFLRNELTVAMECKPAAAV
jgi:osmotically-inducible protein OsmY